MSKINDPHLEFARAALRRAKSAIRAKESEAVLSLNDAQRELARQSLAEDAATMAAAAVSPALKAGRGLLAEAERLAEDDPAAALAALKKGWSAKLAARNLAAKARTLAAEEAARAEAAPAAIAGMLQQ